MATSKHYGLADFDEKQETRATSEMTAIASRISAKTSTPTSKTFSSKTVSKKSKKVASTVVMTSFTKAKGVTSQMYHKYQPKKRQTPTGTKVNDKDDVEVLPISPSISLSPITPDIAKTPSIFSAPEDSSDDDAPNVSMSDSPYEIKPPGSSFLLNVAHVGEIYSSFKNYFTEKHVIRSPAELTAAKLKFEKYVSAGKSTFSQFKYKKPPKLFLLTNLFGLSVNTAEDYMTKLTIHDHKTLLPKHRVSVLLPTTSHWWHTEIKALFVIPINRLINDMITLAHVKDFEDALRNFKLNQRMKDIIATFKSNFLTSSKTIQGKMKPSVLGVRIYNTPTIPSTIPITLTKIKEDQSGARQCKWKELLATPQHVHGIILLTVHGFKITKNGISADLNLEALVCDTINIGMSRAEQKQKSIMYDGTDAGRRFIGRGFFAISPIQFDFYFIGGC